MVLHRRIRLGILASLVALSSILSVPAAPVRAETDCDQLLNDLYGQLSGMDDAVAAALTDLNEQNDKNLDATSTALGRAWDALNEATDEKGRAAAVKQADDAYAAYNAQLAGLKADAQEAITQSRQALADARAQYKAAGCPKAGPPQAPTPQPPTPLAQAYAFHFSGTTGGPGNIPAFDFLPGNSSMGCTRDDPVLSVDGLQTAMNSGLGLVVMGYHGPGDYPIATNAQPGTAMAIVGLTGGGESGVITISSDTNGTVSGTVMVNLKAIIPSPYGTGETFTYTSTLTGSFLLVCAGTSSG